MERDKILMLLCSQDYPEFMLEQTADKIERLTPEIARHFETWAETDENPNLEICGYSFSRLTSEFKMKPVAAFLALDWLVREPKKASAALNRGIRKLNI